LQKNILILILLVIILALGVNMFFQHPNKIIPKENQQQKEALNVDFFSDSCLLILDKNWEPKMLDSALSVNANRLPVFYSTADIISFITNKKDTISFSRNQINRKNPLIIFYPNSAPFLCSANNLKQSLNFYLPSKKQIKTPQDTITDKTSTDTIATKKQRGKIILPKLSSIIGSSIPVIEIERNIEATNDSIIANRNSYYPVLSHNHILHIRFDNDFWDYTDYYYTNGAAIAYLHPVFSSSPISRLLISNGKNGMDYYGLQVVQHMYTGEKPKVDSIIPGDRPWSSYSYIGQMLISFDTKNKIKHYSELNIGLLGPKSGGGFLQNLVHTILPNNSPPKGWDNQIATDFVIDYQYQIQKAIWEAKNTETYIGAAAQIGTLRNNISWGFGGTYGSFIPFYQDISVIKRKRIRSSFQRKIRFRLLANVYTRLIAYDATLQGGMFNKSSIYTLKASQLERFIIEGQAGFGLSYGRFELLFIQFWKSKEFKTGKDHKYVSTKLNIAF